MGGQPDISTRVGIIIEMWKEHITKEIIKKSFQYSCMAPFDIRRLEKMLSAGEATRADADHAPANVILENQATAELLYGKDAINLLALEADAIAKGGIVTRVTETRRPIQFPPPPPPPQNAVLRVLATGM